MGGRGEVALGWDDEEAAAVHQQVVRRSAAKEESRAWINGRRKEINRVSFNDIHTFV